MNKILKIIPDTCYCKDKELNTKCNQLYESINKKEVDGSWWYLHGDLEDKISYDQGVAYNYVELGLYKETPDWSMIRGNEVTELHSNELRKRMYFNGIIDVEVFGINEPCVGYFWTVDKSDITNLDGKKYPHWEQRGLVCLKSDKQGCEYALKKYNERSTWL